MVDIPVTGLRALRNNAYRRANPGPVTADLHRRLSEVWHRAAQAFVKTAVEAMLIETGMSAASFFPLARVVKGGSIEAVQLFIQTNRGRGTTSSGYKRKRSRLGIPEFPDGARSPGIQGPKAGDVRGKQAYRFVVGTPNRPVFRFVFQTAVFQFAKNEREGKSAALDIGMAEFLDVYRTSSTAEVVLSTREYLRGKRIPGVN